jgi:hypothetical protein
MHFTLRETVPRVVPRPQRAEWRLERKRGVPSIYASARVHSHTETLLALRLSAGNGIRVARPNARRGGEARRGVGGAELSVSRGAAWVRLTRNY